MSESSRSGQAHDLLLEKASHDCDLTEWISLGQTSTLLFKDHVLIRRNQNVLEVAPLKVKWEGPHSPMCCFDESATIGKVDANARDIARILEPLKRLITAAEKSRKSTFRRCASCAGLTPPEHFDGELCSACFERSGGVH
jgi:hypothetical protein